MWFLPFWQVLVDEFFSLPDPGIHGHACWYNNQFYFSLFYLLTLLVFLIILIIYATSIPTFSLFPEDGQPFKLGGGLPSLLPSFHSLSLLSHYSIHYSTLPNHFILLTISPFMFPIPFHPIYIAHECGDKNFHDTSYIQPLKNDAMKNGRANKREKGKRKK